MTNEQKEQISQLREEGASYKAISTKLGMSENTISSYCRRTHLDGYRGNIRTGKNCEKAIEADTRYTDACKNYGKTIEVLKGHRKRLFCTDACRNMWWNSHLDLVKRNSYYNFTCPVCGKPFTAYGNSIRKYCSRECYIADRYGREVPCHE